MDSVSAPTGIVRLLALALTAVGSAVITVPVELFGWLGPAGWWTPWAGLTLLFDLPGHLLIIVPIRYATRRDRPVPRTRSPLLIDPWNVWSFPSAHSLRVCTIATIWCLAAPALWWIFVGVAFTIAGTRIILQRHFPSDIIVGAILGVLLGGIAHFVLPAGISAPF